MKRGHHDLEAWRAEMELAHAAYAATQALPQHELYGLTSQIRRAAVSVPSNIAEGAARGGKKEFAHFLRIARGSLSELETLVMLSQEFGYLEARTGSALHAQVDRVTALVNGLIASLHRVPAQL